ncbi:MAG: glutamate synthase large subunit, partial [Chitinivibrionales bacterium]|nr:glutamate synthase large subunit [Chitinivibrionales bacterium]
VRPDCLGGQARACMPFIRQFFASFKELKGDELSRKLYIVRKCIENNAAGLGFALDDFYVVSFSNRTINYKGMFVASQFSEFYPDITDPSMVSALALVHQRYSTNTFPSWYLAHPYRYIAHNGEINTLRGNINKMKARQATVSSLLFGDEIKKIMPVVTDGLSDSATVDNVFELLVQSGRSMEHALMMMVPEAFGPKYHISEDKREFYEYHAAIMEPWDGPAAIAFTDGIKVGACLDRNGLRPARYVVTKSGRVVLASEVGVLEIAPEDVLEKGRLAPGKMILVDTARGRVVGDNEIKATVCRSKPYRHWLENNRIELRGLLQAPGPIELRGPDLLTKELMFGYTLEDIRAIIQPMAENAQEPVGSMGNNAALAVLSGKPELPYNYFKQLFAQVTNPPIDPYRENLVMSLMSFTGREGNLLDETPQHCRQLKLAHPVLSNDDIDKLRTVDSRGFRSSIVDTIFKPAAGIAGLQAALARICREAEQHIDNGYSMLILSDRRADAENAPIPMLLAMAAMHHHLLGVRKRHLSALIIESGEVREVMHFATLIGYGASAINPYCVFEILSDLKTKGLFPAGLSLDAAIENYVTAVKKGLLKIMSKMGVSTLRSYKSAQLFEAVGLDKGFVETYFPGTSSRVGGIGLAQLAGESIARHRAAYSPDSSELRSLDPGGQYDYRRFSEKHLFSPEAVVLLQRAVRENSYELYKQYAAAVDDVGLRACTLRGLFTLKNGPSVPIDEVESADAIVRRFVSSAMSLGSISREAHETIAIAMNRLGAASNSGEGGEDEARYEPLPNGDSRRSAIKQVASGRFGVNISYLVNSRELQIKMAQGAKPGEGGQLPGAKVDEYIAKVRHSMPGVMLISPPPHHDIYSIEDLAQLIFDLKNANPQARVSVKLVAEVGVGTIAAGVAKGKAEMVLISGHDGGTGASPISSIKYAGIPWEIGLAETQQVLVMNALRDKIRVQVDGKMKTGRDVVIGALLGAEEFGFGSATLISLGCIMMRKCHLNTCPVGVATQDPVLRSRFAGKPEYLINFMRFVAAEVREYMAALGFKTMDDMVGHAEMLDTSGALEYYTKRGLDFSAIFAAPQRAPDGALRCTGARTLDLSGSLDAHLLAESKDALDNKQPVRIAANIRNSNRTVGAYLSGEIARRHGSKGLPKDTITVQFTGSAGQSFGAFLAPGITFELNGDANDYMGKGLSGGRIVIRPRPGYTFRPHNNIITGNVNLFGATEGEVYIQGMAGERFAVRNSGALAVVEGVGDHGCEYMTGGRVVVLGRTGVNFAAGMSGGIAYVLDENQLFDTRCNLELVDLEPVVEEAERKFLYGLVQTHVTYTGSAYAAQILRDWAALLPLFVKVIPQDYRQALERMKKAEFKESEVVAMTEEVFL